MQFQAEPIDRPNQMSDREIIERLEEAEYQQWRWANMRDGTLMPEEEPPSLLSRESLQISVALGAAILTAMFTVIGIGEFIASVYGS